MRDEERSLDDASGALAADSRWMLALEAGRIGVWEWDVTTDAVWWSRRVHEITRVSEAEFPGTLEALVALVHIDDRPTLRRAFEMAVEVRQPFHLEIRLALPDDPIRWIETRAMPVIDADGAPRTVIGTAVDITERKEQEIARDELLHREQASRTEAETERERLDFLTAASREIRSVLDPVVVRRAATELIVPNLGDWAIVVNTDGEGVSSLALAEESPGESPRRGKTTMRLTERFEPFEHVLATGEPYLATNPTVLPVISDEAAERTIELSASSVAVVPLVFGSGITGIIAAGHLQPGRPYDSGDLFLFARYAETVAATIDKAEIFEERSAIARVLQQSLLPASIPEVDGIEIAAEYLPVGEGLIVGGDFYDVFRVSDGRYAFAVGDVSGKGSEAATVTALVRHSIRAYAETHDDPADVLVAVNEAIRHHGPSPRFCTAVYGVLTVGTGVDVHIATGGHPLPMVLNPDGSVDSIGRPGTLLGVFPHIRIKTISHSLASGSALVLYTDGVLECRRDRAPFGEERLRSLLSESVGASASALAGRIGAAVVEYRDEPTDDVAVVVLRRLPIDAR